MEYSVANTCIEYWCRLETWEINIRRWIVCGEWEMHPKGREGGGVLKNKHSEAFMYLAGSILGQGWGGGSDVLNMPLPFTHSTHTDNKIKDRGNTKSTRVLYFTLFIIQTYRKVGNSNFYFFIYCNIYLWGG